MGSNNLDEIKNLETDMQMEELKEDSIAMLEKLVAFQFIEKYDVCGATVDIKIDDNTSWKNDAFEGRQMKLAVLHQFVMGFYVASCMASEKHKQVVDSYQRKLAQLQDSCEKNKNLIIVP